jgi:hypothetical protein
MYNVDKPIEVLLKKYHDQFFLKLIIDHQIIKLDLIL